MTSSFPSRSATSSRSSSAISVSVSRAVARTRIPAMKTIPSQPPIWTQAYPHGRCHLGNCRTSVLESYVWAKDATAAVAGLEAAVDGLLGVSADGLAATELAAVLESVEVQRRRLEAVDQRLLAAASSAGVAAAFGQAGV